MIDMEDLADLDHLASNSSLYLRRFWRVAWAVSLYWVSNGFNEVFASQNLFSATDQLSSGENTDMSQFNNLVHPTRLPPCRQLVFRWSQSRICLAIEVFFPRIISLVEVRIVELFLLGGSQAAFLQTPSFDAICKCKLCHLRGASQLLSPELLQIVFGCFWQKQSVSLCTRPCLPTCASSINFFHTACCRRFTLVFQARKRDCSPYPEEKKAGQHESGWERSLKQKACCDRFEKGGSWRC